MKEFDGFDFFQKVRDNPRFRTIPFIFLTSHQLSEHKMKAFELGADDFITKPFNVAELIGKTEAILKRVEIYRTYGQRQRIGIEAEKSKRKILIVDDELMMPAFLQKQLENEGYICEVVESADLALRLAPQFQPDLIVSDYLMPEMDGFVFRKELQKNAKLRDIPFIFLTSSEDESLMIQGFDLGIKDYLIKTSNPKLLVVKIKNHLTAIQNERASTLNELKEAAASLSLEINPDNVPEIPGFTISHWFQPFKDIPGGDFLDFIALPDGRQVIVLGDVMGKRWNAWFYAYSFVSYFRSTIRVVAENAQGYSAKAILQKVNEIIFNDSKISEVFSAVSLFLIDPMRMSFGYAGAGDNPPLLVHASGSGVDDCPSEGLLLGARFNGKFSEREIVLQPGDRLVAYTDGITESRNREGEMFGIDRFRRVLGGLYGTAEFMQQFKATFGEFTLNNYSDDVTLLVIERNSIL